MTGYTTRAAAKALDGDLASAIERAGYVLRDTEPAYVEVAGHVLEPVEGGTWQVYDSNDVYDEGTDDADPVDELVVDRFRSARELVGYLSGLKTAETNEGDVTAPEVA